jgi:hypothetical protein
MARISKNHLMGRILPRPRVKRGEKQRAGTLVTQRIVSKTLLVKYSEITYAFKETIYMHDSQTANSHLSKRHVQDRFIILFRLEEVTCSYSFAIRILNALNHCLAAYHEILWLAVLWLYWAQA